MTEPKTNVGDLKSQWISWVPAGRDSNYVPIYPLLLNTNNNEWLGFTRENNDSQC
jgi:hypothetical protein